MKSKSTLPQTPQTSPITTPQNATQGVPTAPRPLDILDTLDSSNLLFRRAGQHLKPDRRMATRKPSWFKGKLVKVMFETMTTPPTEIMWVEVRATQRGSCVGVLRNQPHYCPRIALGTTVVFRPRDIVACQ